MQPDEAKQAILEVRKRLSGLEHYVLRLPESSPFRSEMLLNLYEAQEACSRLEGIYQRVLSRADG